jgi:hypothetical protein
MSDPVDDAQEHIEREEAVRRKYRHPPKLEVEPTGECLNCAMPVPVSHRWCDSACRADWEKWQKK